MNTDDLTVSEDTKAAIRGFLEHELTAMGVKDVIIEGMLDHDDEPSLRIVVEYNDQGPAMDTRRLARLVTPLRTLLLQRGEKRFPFIRHNVTDRRPLMSYVKR